MKTLLIIFLAIGFSVTAQDPSPAAPFEKAVKEQIPHDINLLAQAAVVVPGKGIELEVTPHVVTEEEVTDKQKESPENKQFTCKVSNTMACFGTGQRCSQFAQTPKSALECWEDFYKCVTRIKDQCESEFPVLAKEEDST